MKKASSSLFALALLLLVALGCKWSGSLGSNTSDNTASKTTTNTSSTTTRSTSSTESSDSDGVRVDKIQLAKDDGSGGDGEEVTSFEPTDNPQHFVVGLSAAKSGTKVKAEWYIVNAGGQTNSKFLDYEKVTRGLENKVDFQAKLQKPWPAGDYRIDILINGKQASSMNYKVIE